MLDSADQNGLTNKFGTIIVDECHHIPAESYRNIIGKLASFYLYGLTATPFRKYNDGKLIFIHLGEIISEMYESGEQLLDDLLKYKKVIHYRQLRYLAEKHESDILKLRFVLNPFSFVFLLSGQEQFHLVMETLDTREATYIWHIEKDKQELRSLLQVIDRQLNIIRNVG